MDSLFLKQEEIFTFYKRDGEKIERKTELRFDPLTGESSRIVVDPGIKLTPPNYTDMAEKTGGENCPFCLENIHEQTPIFSKEQDNITHGKAIVFPNLFPYSKYNGVTIFSDQHFIRLEEFTTSLLKDAFIACQTYIKRVIDREEKPVYISINWNYLPLSGGSMLHPHLHVIISESATNYQNRFERKCRAFQENHEVDYLSSLYQYEKEVGERWIGENGNIAWLHAYSPKGHNDFISIFRDKSSIEDLTDQDWSHFAKGLQAIFATLAEQGLASFNMGLTFANTGSPIHARLIPRLDFGELHTSDFNYFQVIHDEGLTYKAPEKVAALARKHF
ncbi:hypothetical protein GMD78_17505 [Ornithinibacillus sp. L9]|uniref:Galactose-1-phosphate uridylyltransferase n=1 Tax=Ornithinibacillus caprae TaxID=2678566 RepID=A0A6N8FKJ1_9BACI|nr:hypothetical protein [Ornithinibacillus caprae]MUK90172.1 hypothetical protein [Ornithinibacillus caprae]